MKILKTFLYISFLLLGIIGGAFLPLLYLVIYNQGEFLGVLYIQWFITFLILLKKCVNSDTKALTVLQESALACTWYLMPLWAVISLLKEASKEHYKA